MEFSAQFARINGALDSASKVRPKGEHKTKMFDLLIRITVLCSDITNDQLGISGETGHGGANLYIY